MAGRILVVDDDVEIAKSLTRLLGRDGYYVEARASTEEAVTLIERDGTFDLALLDVGCVPKPWMVGVGIDGTYVRVSLR